MGEVRQHLTMGMLTSCTDTMASQVARHSDCCRVVCAAHGLFHRTVLRMRAKMVVLGLNASVCILQADGCVCVFFLPPCPTCVYCYWDHRPVPMYYQALVCGEREHISGTTRIIPKMQTRPQRILDSCGRFANTYSGYANLYYRQNGESIGPP
jgi:hypothetical protein